MPKRRAIDTEPTTTLSLRITTSLDRAIDAEARRLALKRPDVIRMALVEFMATRSKTASDIALAGGD